MSIPAPSAHERVALCPASDSLPHIREAEMDGATSRGLAVHHYLAAVPVVGWQAALAQVPEEWRADCEVIELTRLPACRPESFAAEVCLAYNLTTGQARVLGHDLSYEEMKALLLLEEMPAKIDTLGLGEDFVILWDYKSGRKRHGPARTIRQLRAYALAAARAYGKSKAIVGIIRIGDDGRPWFSGGDAEGLLDELELAMIEEEIRELVAKRDEARRAIRANILPRLVVGDHCTYCPALHGCPAHMVGIRALAGEAMGPTRLLSGAGQEELDELWRQSAKSAMAVASETDLARAVAMVKVAKRRLEFLEDSLQRRATQQPIPRADGDLWGPCIQDSVEDVETAKQMLTLLYGEAVAEAATETKITMSKKSIGRALRDHVLQSGGRIGKLEEDTFQALRDAGAIQPETVFRWYTPEEDDKP